MDPEKELQETNNIKEETVVEIENSIINDKEEIEVEKKDKVGQMLKCETCSYKCKTVKSVKKPMKTKYKELSEQNYHISEKCGVKFNNTDTLKKHKEKEHEKRNVKKEFDMEMLKEFLY